MKIFKIEFIGKQKSVEERIGQQKERTVPAHEHQLTVHLPDLSAVSDAHDTFSIEI